LEEAQAGVEDEQDGDGGSFDVFSKRQLQGWAPRIC